jgi:hypothetical protein
VLESGSASVESFVARSGFARFFGATPPSIQDESIEDETAAGTHGDQDRGRHHRCNESTSLAHQVEVNQTRWIGHSSRQLALPM